MERFYFFCRLFMLHNTVFSGFAIAQLRGLSKVFVARASCECVSVNQGVPYRKRYPQKPVIWHVDQL